MLVSGPVPPSSMASACPLSSAGLTCPQVSSLLDSAAEQMMVSRDFQTAFETCDRGLRDLRGLRGLSDPEDGRSADLKTGLCVLGVQALAEMNRWKEVLTWVLQQYQDQDQIPAEIVKMCIVLHWKVGQPVLVQDVVRLWLLSPSNRTLSGSGSVAELFLLLVLLPLGQKRAALDLIQGDLGVSVFTEDQRQAALDLVEEQDRRTKEPPPDPHPRSEPVPPEGSGPPCRSLSGSVLQKLDSVLRSLCRRLFGSSSLQRLFLAAVLLYMLVLRLDPALPSSFMWISKVLQLLRAVWRTMFAPYHQAATQNPGL